MKKVGIPYIYTLLGEALWDEISSLEELSQHFEFLPFAQKGETTSTLFANKKTYPVKIMNKEEIRKCDILLWAGTHLFETYENTINENNIINIYPSFREEDQYLEKEVLPNINVITLQKVLEPLLQKIPLKTLHIHCQQSLSYKGKEGLQALKKESELFFQSLASVEPQLQEFLAPVAFNVNTGGSPLQKNFNTLEETLMNVQLRKLLKTEALISSVCSYVPSFIGACFSLFIETKESATLEEIENILEKNKNLNYQKPHVLEDLSIRENHGCEEISVGRLRQISPCHFLLWISADTLKRQAMAMIETLQKFS